MRILITGASGLLGANLALEAAALGHQVFGQAHRQRLETTAFSALTADLTEQGAFEQLFVRARPDWVIHCAAVANLEDCERDPGLAERLNAHVPGKLAEVCRQGGARLLHISTDAVFDGQRGGYRESDIPNPQNVYAQTKLDGERAVAQADPQALIARVNLFGYSPSGGRSLAEFFLYNLIAGNPLKGFTDVVFCPLLVNDIAAIFFRMLEKGLKGLYHVFGSECLSKYDFGVRIAGRFGLDPALIAPVSVADGGLAAARSPNLSMDIHKLSRDLGQAPPSFSPMLERFYTLYQQGYPQRLKELRVGVWDDGKKGA
jgi:dTDP-4-dehydrorhamnose reductase